MTFSAEMTISFTDLIKVPGIEECLLNGFAYGVDWFSIRGAIALGQTGILGPPKTAVGKLNRLFDYMAATIEDRPPPPPSASEASPSSRAFLSTSLPAVVAVQRTIAFEACSSKRWMAAADVIAVINYTVPLTNDDEWSYRRTIGMRAAQKPPFSLPFEVLGIINSKFSGTMPYYPIKGVAQAAIAWHGDFLSSQRRQEIERRWKESENSAMYEWYVPPCADEDRERRLQDQQPDKEGHLIWIGIRREAG